MSILRAAGVPTRELAWDRAVDGLAAIFGVGSAVVGIGAVLIIPFGIALQITEDHTRVQTRIHQLTSLGEATYLLMTIGTLAVPGIIGLGLAKRRGKAVARVSLAGAAARLSIMGLVFDGLLLAALAALLGYRWLMWG